MKELIKIILIFLLTLSIIGIIAGGCYYGIKVVQSEKSISKTYGIADSEDPYAQYDLYSHDFADIVFTSNGNERKYETTIPVDVEFDGESSKFNVLINDTPCNTTQSTYGIIDGTFSLYFQNNDGTITTAINLNIKITIFTESVKYEFAAIADDNAFQMLKTYIAINGFKVRIIDEQYRQDSISTFVPIGLAQIDFSEELKTTETGIVPQSISVFYGELKLQENSDYTVSYSDNKKFGWGHATITGKGYYCGAVIRNFKVRGSINIETRQNFEFASTNNVTKIKTFAVPGLIAGQDITVSITQNCKWRLGIWYDKGTYSTKRSNGYWIIGSEFPDSGYGDDFRYTFYCDTDNILTMEYQASTASGWVTNVTITAVSVDFYQTKAVGYNKYLIVQEPQIHRAEFNKTIPVDEFNSPKVIELNSETCYYTAHINGLNYTKDFVIAAQFCVDETTYGLNSNFNELLIDGISVYIEFYSFNNEELFIQINTSNFGVLDGATIKILNITQ